MDCASPLTSYFYLLLLTNAIWYSALLGISLAAAVYRLPHHSPNQYCDTSTPIVGSSGSTLLHLAVENGHTNAICTLLFYGAPADKADKHDVGEGCIGGVGGW